MKFSFISADVVQGNEPIYAEQFQYYVQRAVLLALKEDGIMDYAEFCGAEQELKHQYQKFITVQ